MDRATPKQGCFVSYALRSLMFAVVGTFFFNPPLMAAATVTFTEASGDPTGQYNAYLRWKINVVDADDHWEMTVFLADLSPKSVCTVDLTPRRCQKFDPKPGIQWLWETTDEEGKSLHTGQAVADKWGLVTLKDLRIGKAKLRVAIEPAP